MPSKTPFLSPIDAFPVLNDARITLLWKLLHASLQSVKRIPARMQSRFRAGRCGEHLRHPCRIPAASSKMGKAEYCVEVLQGVARVEGLAAMQAQLNGAGLEHLVAPNVALQNIARMAPALHTGTYATRYSDGASTAEGYQLKDIMQKWVSACPLNQGDGLNFQVAHPCNLHARQLASCSFAAETS